MGANAREFLHFRMEEKYYNQLTDEQRHGLELHKVEVEGFDYSHDETWCKLKSESVRAYKALKDREYDLRHNLKL